MISKMLAILIFRPKYNQIIFLGILQHLVGLTSSSPTKTTKSETIAEELEDEDVPELDEDFDEACRTEGL